MATNSARIQSIDRTSKVKDLLHRRQLLEMNMGAVSLLSCNFLPFQSPFAHFSSSLSLFLLFSITFPPPPPLSSPPFPSFPTIPLPIRMHHFIVKFSKKFRLGRQGGIDSLTKILRTLLTLTLNFNPNNPKRNQGGRCPRQGMRKWHSAGSLGWPFPVLKH